MENFYNSKYFQLIQPSGSGKSITISYVMSKRLLENPKLKLVITVPQTFIAKTFGRMIFNHNGQIIEWDIFHDLCKDVTYSKIEYLINFLENKELLQDIKSRIVITSHQAFAQMVEKLQDINVFDNVMVVIDEAHHIMYDESEITNKVGEFIKQIFNNKLNTGIWLATATPYRSDNNNIIPKEILDQFDKHFLPLDKHWEDNIKHIKSFDFNFVIYKQNQILNEVKEVFKLGHKKSIIFCPYVGHLMKDIDKDIFKKELINTIKEEWVDCKILDLIEVNGRDKRKEILLDNEDAKHVDIILTLKIFDEGSDWVHAEQCIDLSPSNHLRVMYQRFGRLWRDYINKYIITYYCFLPFETKFKDEDERRLHLSKSFNTLAASLLLQDIIQPIKYPTTLKGEHKKKMYINPLQEAIQDDDKRSEMLEKIIKKLMVMKSVSENPTSQDVKQWIKCLLTVENITEKQDQIIDYIGLVFRRMSRKTNHKKIDWSNALDIENLIEGGFDKIWVNDIFENLRVFGTNVCTAETFKEFRDIINGKKNNVDDYIKQAEDSVNSITGLVPPKCTFGENFCSIVRKYPGKFSHIIFEKRKITIDEYIKKVNNKVNPITGLAPPKHTFGENCVNMILSHPKEFSHIKFEEYGKNTLDDYIKQAEDSVNPITGLAPPKCSFGMNFWAMLYNHPGKFSHIQFEKRKTLNDYIKQAEDSINPITGLAPPKCSFGVGFSNFVYRYPGKFSHIQFEKRKTLNDYIKQAEDSINPITGLAPPKCSFDVGFSNFVYKHPGKFSHIQFENGYKKTKEI
jgi:superfamily II DNA or RNA helicase/uncharacterized protein YdcH (DUF465 family)